MPALRWCLRGEAAADGAGLPMPRGHKKSRRIPRLAKPGAFAKQKSLEGCVRRTTPVFFLQSKKSRRRPTLARAGPALPSAMEPLTAVFGMGTGMATPLWPPAKAGKSGTKEKYDSYETSEQALHVVKSKKLSRTSG